MDGSDEREKGMSLFRCIFGADSKITTGAVEIDSDMLKTRVRGSG